MHQSTLKKRLAGHIENLHRVNEHLLGPKSILGYYLRPLSQLQKLTLPYVVKNSTGDRHQWFKRVLS